MSSAREERKAANGSHTSEIKNRQVPRMVNNKDKKKHIFYRDSNESKEMFGSYFEKSMDFDVKK